jgi:hypothetical protein
MARAQYQTGKDAADGPWQSEPTIPDPSGKAGARAIPVGTTWRSAGGERGARPCARAIRARATAVPAPTAGRGA